MRLGNEERVRRGIQLLQERGPKGWRRRVRLTRLNINDCMDCVLGQIYGNYDDAFAGPLGGSLRHGERSARFGFALYADEMDITTLNEEWRRQLREVPR